MCIDRSFYRPLTEGHYERDAGQVPADFRFVVKAPSLLTGALLRGEQALQGLPLLLERLRALLRALPDVRGVTGAWQRACVTISHRAEGCAPLWVQALAQGLAAG